MKTKYPSLEIFGFKPGYRGVRADAYPREHPIMRNLAAFVQTHQLCEVIDTPACFRGLDLDHEWVARGLDKRVVLVASTVATSCPGWERRLTGWQRRAEPLYHPKAATYCWVWPNLATAKRAAAAWHLDQESQP